jgi:hypothetical protein
MNVQDIKSKTVPLVLQDGKERHLRFTLNAMAELEEKYGSIEKAFERVEKNSSVVALRFILWAGLIWEDPDLTEREVGDLIDIAYMQELIGTLGSALNSDMPTPEQSNTGAGKLIEGGSPN